MDSDLDDTSDIGRESNSDSKRELVNKIGQWADHPSWDPFPDETDAEICERLLNLEVRDLTSELNINDQPTATISHIPRFQVIQKIGEGAFGVVFKVYDNRLKRYVGVKILKPSLGAERKLIRRFIREAEAIAMMQCENIIKIYDVGKAGNQPYLVMELIEGGNLRNWLAKQISPCEISHVVSSMHDIAKAVSYAHSRGILHRDLKPSNILLKISDSSTNSNSRLLPILTDFGLAKQLTTDNLTAVDLTADTERVGTLRYMSPEQASGNNADIATTSDVFSLGIIFYELLTQQLPFSGDTNAEIIYRICHETPTRLRSLRKDVPKDLEAVILKCMEKQPAHRYSSASEVVAELDRLVNGQPVEASNPTLTRRFLTIVKRNPIRTFVYSFIAICLLALFFAWLALIARERAQFRRAENNLRLALYGISQAISEYALAINEGIPITHQLNLQVLLNSLQVHQKLADQNPSDTTAQHRLAVAHHFVANGYARVSNTEQVNQHRTAFRDIIEELLAKEPDNSQYIFDGFMANYLLSLEIPSSDTLESTSARKLAFSRAETYIQKLITKHPDNIDFRDAFYGLRVAKVLKSPDNDKNIQELIDVSEQSFEFYSRNPTRPLLVKPCVEAKILLGELEFKKHDFAESLKYFSEADKLITEIFPESKRDATVWHSSLRAKFHLACIHFVQQEWKKTDQQAEQAFECWRRYNEYQPQATEFLTELLKLRFGANHMLGRYQDADALNQYSQQAAKKLKVEEQVTPFVRWVDTMIEQGPEAAEKCRPF